MAPIKAFLFDQDGVIIDTERDGHRVAFNRTFAEFGFDVEWDVETYHRLLRVGGGKERMRSFLHETGFGKPVPGDDEDDLIKALHKRKTDLFVELIESGALPLRPGVRRFMAEVNARGLTLGICTTSNERAAKAVSETVLEGIRFDFVLAGDIVSRKKPDPEIYQLALERCGLRPNECVVIEDSNNGAAAAKAAGMYVVATVNPYTKDEDLSMADIVVSNLGDAGGEIAVILAGPEDYRCDGVVTAEDLIKIFST
jgi:HAD superfamily hydrolase (TIGR01509 family)